MMSEPKTNKQINMDAPLKDGIKEMLMKAIESGSGYGWKDSILELADGTKITFDLEVRVKEVQTA